MGLRNLADGGASTMASGDLSKAPGIWGNTLEQEAAKAVSNEQAPQNQNANDIRK